MSTYFLKLLNVSVIWEISAPFDTSHPEKLNIKQIEGIPLLPPYNKYREVHEILIEAYKIAIKPGMLLDVTCAFPDELFKWERQLEYGIMQVIMACEKAAMMMKSEYKGAVLADYRNAYEALYREVAYYNESKEFKDSTRRAWKVMKKEYKYEEGDYERLLANWAEKYEFATIMRNRKFKKIQNRLETLKEIIMGDEFSEIFQY